MYIGIDESGTGAWSGPFVVCAVVSDDQTDAELTRLGVRDSKQLSDRKRRELLPHIADVVHCAVCEVVGVACIVEQGSKPAWREAVRSVACRALQAAPIVTACEMKLIVDGPVDSRLAVLLSKRFSTVVGENKADQIYPAVSAASIVAKTLRNDFMLMLHNRFPAYGWDNNAGYGTKEHLDAVKKHGLTGQHRPIRSLQQYIKEK